MKNTCQNRLTILGIIFIMLLPLSVLAGDTILKIKAKGTKAGGVYAHFKVIVNDVEVGRKFTTANCSEYFFDVPFSTDEINEIRIEFDNDKYSVGEDRNLFVNCLFIGNEIPIKANKSTAKYITKSGQEIDFEGMMGWNGSLIFDITAIQQCPGNVTLASQAEVNSAGCQYVDGNLIISGADITDLSPLGMLTSVKGGLVIRNNPKLQTITGLNSLIEAGFVSIEFNDKLHTIDGLNSLSKCGGMQIQHNKELKTVKCFQTPTI